MTVDQIHGLMHRVGFFFFACALLVGCSDNPALKTPAPDTDNGGLILPAGFGALVVADSVGPTRHIAVNENGDIYAKLRIIEGDKGNVGLRDTNGDGKADIQERFGDYPNDGSFATEMRIHNGYLYFSSELVIYRQQLSEDQLIPAGKPEVLVRDHHPLQWHNAKSLAFDQDGGMYVTFSAPTNICEVYMPDKTYATPYPCPQLNDQAGIWKFSDSKQNQNQSDGQRYATGLRSVVAMSWNHTNNTLYAVTHGRDWFRVNAPQLYSEWQNAVLPAEEFIKINEGDNFGWPYSYYDPFKQARIISPEYGGNGTRVVKDFTEPLMDFPAHWAPNDMLFYKGNLFPERYKQGAFVAFHGSTNRNPYPQAGYIVAFVPFIDGKPANNWEVFADGFTGLDTIRSMMEVKYRPMGLSEGPDGSLYISESKNGKIWRVVFNGDRDKFGANELDPMEKLKSKPYLKTPDEVEDRLKVNQFDN